jgi:hypothetical protein
MDTVPEFYTIEKIGKRRLEFVRGYTLGHDLLIIMYLEIEKVLLLIAVLIPSSRWSPNSLCRCGEHLYSTESTSNLKFWSYNMVMERSTCWRLDLSCPQILCHGLAVQCNQLALVLTKRRDLMTKSQICMIIR